MSFCSLWLWFNDGNSHPDNVDHQVFKGPAKEPVKSSGKGFTVIKLFTSEGCSRAK